MSDHKVTEHILNAGLQRSATISCSCGLSVEIANIRKLSLRAGRKQLDGMHKNLTPKNSPKPKKEKTTEKQKPLYNYVDEPRDADEDNKGTKEE